MSDAAGMIHRDLDLNALRGKPLEAIKYLVNLRNHGIIERLTDRHGQEVASGQRMLLAPLTDALSALVNPLLLATALSISIVRNRDFTLFLRRYVSGLDIPDLETSLLTMPIAPDDADLPQMLILEDQFVDSFVEYGMEILVEEGPLIPERERPSMWDAYWGAWLAANPFVRANSQNAWRQGARYSRHMNSRIHYARELAEYQLNEINKEINTLLQQESCEKTDTAIERATAAQLNATALVDRARRLYYWAPHEIHAKSAVAEFLFKMIDKASADKDFQSKYRVDIHEAQEKAAPLLLPPSIEAQIQRRQPGSKR